MEEIVPTNEATMGPSRGYDFCSVEKVSHDYFCGICRSILRDAMEMPCSHVMCKACIEKSKESWSRSGDVLTWPQCQHNFMQEEVKSCKTKDDHIKLIKIFCKCRSNGCEWTGVIEKYPKHEVECLYKKVACPNDGCYAFLMKKVLSQHIKVCGQRRVKCKLCHIDLAYEQYAEHSKNCTRIPSRCVNTSCTLEFPKDRLQNHLDSECLYQDVVCSYGELGCETKMLRKNLEHHLKDSIQQHMLLMMKQLDNVTSEVTFLKQELDIKTKELELASLKILALEKKISS